MRRLGTRSRLIQQSLHFQPVISVPRNMSTSNLTTVPIKLPSDLTRQQLLQFPAFRIWISSLEKSLQAQSSPSHPFHNNPFKLRGIEVQACDYFAPDRLGFLKLKADVQTNDNQWIPGAVFLRGGSVAMLLILRSEGEEYVLLTVQPRVATGSLGFVELPAGMLDDSGSFTGKAAAEIREETGLEVSEAELVNLTELALSSRTAEDDTEESHLQTGVYSSPGGCDEFLPIFMARKNMSRDEMEGLKGKLTGLRDDGEKITLKVCRLKDLWKVGMRDAKTLAALALYEGLKREGKV